MAKEKQTSTRGLITPILEKMVNGATWVSRYCLGNAPPAGEDLKLEVAAVTARCVDIYVLTCIVIEILVYFQLKIIHISGIINLILAKEITPILDYKSFNTTPGFNTYAYTQYGIEALEKIFE